MNVESEARSTFNVLALTAAAALACALPIFYNRYFVYAEEGPHFFASLYGITPFQPGANRNLSLLQFLFSPARTYLAAVWSQYVGTLFITTLGCAVFLVRCAPRVAWTSAAIAIAIVALTLLPLYQQLFSPGYPHIMPLGMALGAVGLLAPSTDARRTEKLARAAIATLLIFLSAGINQTAALIAGAFIVTHWAIHALFERRQTTRSDVLALAVGLSTGVSAVVWAGLQAAFVRYYPQSTLSLYSPAADYFHFSISLNEAIKSYEYVIATLADVSNGWTALAEVAILGSVPLAAVCLWRARQSHLFSPAVVGTALYIAAILAGLAISQNAHVNYIDGPGRARYFVAIYIAVAIAFAILASTAFALVLRQAWLRFHRLSAAALAVAAIASFAWGSTHHGRSLAQPFPIDPNSSEVARRVRDHHAVALVGDYYTTWNLQYLINNGEGHTPTTVPVTTRTESYPLRVFRIWQRALLSNGRMLIACVRQQPLNGPFDGTPPGTCEQKINWNVERGAFPAGPIKLVEPVAVSGNLELSFYELGACPSDILFRAEKSGSGYVIRDGGFVIANCRDLYENNTGPFLSHATKSVGPE